MRLLLDTHVVLWQLSVLEKERGGRNVPTAMLYGRVVEHVNISEVVMTATAQASLSKVHKG